MGRIARNRRKEILYLSLTTKKKHGEIAEEVGVARTRVSEILRQDIPEMDGQELRELLAAIIQRSRDEEVLS